MWFVMYVCCVVCGMCFMHVCGMHIVCRVMCVVV